MSGEDKFRFAGRLGMGSVLGSKNILAIVAYAEKDDYPKGDERLKPINQEIGRGDQSKVYRHPMNRDGGGGTGRLERVLVSMVCCLLKTLRLMEKTWRNRSTSKPSGIPKIM